MILKNRAIAERSEIGPLHGRFHSLTLFCASLNVRPSKIMMAQTHAIFSRERIRDLPQFLYLHLADNGFFITKDTVVLPEKYVR